ncbi:hypothetical protein NLL40_11705 [Corynebacterium accolens]|uniref:hypothetical protein n=2 Tax=Corynebacterium accolens TaxID=38284 RepID=UPI00266EE3C4|nr:hypothetical protein [Corynebacterium accolens]WKS69000.1 hypothetical protein NLL40_11705 [Corynebacterium accolens]
MEYVLMAAAVIGFMAWLSMSAFICLEAFDDLIDGSWKIGFLSLAVGIVSLVSCFATMFNLIDSHDDNSEHCGPGTVYRESSHYNAATKAPETDWWCEVK